MAADGIRTSSADAFNSIGLRLKLAGGYSRLMPGSQLRQTMSSVGGLIPNQYLIGYKRPEGAQSGKWRQIRVRMQSTRHGSLRLNAKGGYYAPSE